MALTRITQNMMMDRSLSSLQTALGRLARTQEQLSTGRIINRPSDSPTDTSAAMRMRASISDQAQFGRNAEDGLGWLGQIDTTLTSMLDDIRRARDLALQGANSGSMGDVGRQALATEIDQIRQSAIAGANTTYLGRPVFGGITAGGSAYGDALADDTWTGVAGPVNRTVAQGIKIQVNVNGTDVFGADGDSLFALLEDLSVQLTSNDTAGIQASLGKLDAAMNTMTTTLADAGTKSNRIEKAVQASKDVTVNLQTSLSNVENVDLPKAMVDLQLQEVAYQAALATTARVMQPSLMDFLR